MHVPTEISPRRIAVSAVPLVALVVLVSTPQLLGRHVASAGAELADASPLWLWLALAAFLTSLLATICSWRTALVASGARLSSFDAAARYGVGCLVNTFAPASLGDAVRVALLSKKLPGANRLWATGGAAASVSALRGVVLAALVVAASLTGALPRWPAAVLCGLTAVAAVGGWLLWRRHPHGRLGRFLEAFTVLLRSPGAAGRVAAWSVLSQGAKVGAAAAVAAALAVPHPLLAALVIVPTLQLATILPLTPGNIGVTSGAVALALQTRGVGVAQALATGIAFHAAETVVGIAFGVAGTLAVIPVPTVVRRLAVAGGCTALAVGFGATLLSLV